MVTPEMNAETQFNRLLKEFFDVQSRNSERMEMRSTTGSARPAHLVRKTWKARMLMMMGPRISNPKLRVFGMATRMPPATSSTLTNAR